MAFRYAEAVNGSARNIAGVLNAAGNVLGMMPHPERAIEPAHGGSDGRPERSSFGQAENVLAEFGHTHDHAEAATLLDPQTRALLRAALDRLADAGTKVDDAGLRRPTLDDVFLELTGRLA